MITTRNVAELNELIARAKEAAKEYLPVIDFDIPEETATMVAPLTHTIYSCFVRFNDEELDQMPKWFWREMVKYNDGCARVDKFVKDDDNGLTASIFYTVFYKINGNTISATDSDLNRAKKKFIFAVRLESKRLGLED